MTQTVFADDALARILVPFAARVEARLAALPVSDVATTFLPPPASGALELATGLLDGLLSDLMQEIQQMRVVASSTNRGLASELIAEFIYLLAAFVDEMLISTLKSRLPHRLNGGVEHMLFGTRDAGEQVFLKIDLLLARRSQLDLSLAGAYLLVLSLGFKGQYFLQGSNEVLSRQHRDLAAFALLPLGGMPPQRRAAVIGDWERSPRRIPMRQFLFILWLVIGLTWAASIVGMDIFWRAETAFTRDAAAELNVPVSQTHQNPKRVNNE